MRFAYIGCLEFKYLGCVLDESSTDKAVCSRKVVSGRRISGAISSLVNASGVQLACAMVLLETLLVSVLMYGSETMIWKEEERSRIIAVQVDKIRSLLGIARMDKVPNAQKELMKVFYNISAIWRVENERIVKRVYVGLY